MELRPYTIEELNARIDKAERQIEEGHFVDIDDVLREMDEDFELDEQLEKFFSEKIGEVQLEVV